MDKNFPLYLMFSDRTYSVLGYIEDTTDFIDNKGYIKKKNGQIYICSKDEEPRHKDVPIMFVGKDGTITYKDTHNIITAKEFTENNLHDLSIVNIAEQTHPDDILYNEEELADINAATTVFIPTINDTDDPLKKIVKKIIIDKKIDINRLKGRLPQKYGLTNMKSALVGTTKMSISNFNIWMEILGIDFDIIVSDNGSDKENPLPNPIHYSSTNNMMKILK